MKLTGFQLSNLEESILTVLYDSKGESVFALSAFKAINTVHDKHGIEHFKKGSFYPLLRRLEKLGLIVREWEYVDIPKTTLRKIRITPDGMSKISAIWSYKEDLKNHSQQKVSA